MYERISKSAAKKMFARGETVYLCPCKMRPGGGWHMECPVQLTEDLISSAKYWETAHSRRHETYQVIDLWKGNLVDTAWELIYNNWAGYNTNYECGYYAHYYREE